MPPRRSCSKICWVEMNGSCRLGKSDADALVLEDVEQCMMAQLDPANVEISVVGDFDAAECERLAVAYVGAVPRPTDVEPLTDRDPSSTNARLPASPGEPRRVHVPDGPEGSGLRHGRGSEPTRCT